MAKKSYWDEIQYPQPTEQELRRNVEETVRKASKKGKLLNPVVLSGRKIALSWWGQAWCKNLERYADFETRLSRGQRKEPCRNKLRKAGKKTSLIAQVISEQFLSRVHPAYLFIEEG